MSGGTSLERFLSYATGVRTRVDFDADERDPRVRSAPKLRRLLSRARDGGPWREDFDALFHLAYDGLGGMPLPLLSPRQVRWVRSWAVSDPQSLREALAVFLADGDSAEERFGEFATRARQAAANIEGDLFEGDVLVVGSLFNFALEPEALPLVRRQAFRWLEHALEQPPAHGDLVSDYAHHVAFAGLLAEHMRSAGIDVRDMVDVQCLLELAVYEQELWHPDQQTLSLDLAGERRQSPQPDVYLSACAIYRNEAPFLAEWLEFHRLVGVERFFLYDNLSTDDHLDVLGPYLAEGIAVVHRWEAESRPQIPAYQDCIQRHRAESRWIAFLDLDEFLFSPSGTPLPELLPEYERWPAVAVNWVMFGPSGHRKPPAGLVTESYTRCGYAFPQAWVKCVVDPARVERCGSAHHFHYTSGTAMNENHRPVRGGISRSASVERLRINHYYTKSQEEALAKWDRVTADNAKERNALFPVDELFESLDLREDRAILRYLTPLRAALASRTELGAPP